MLHYSEIPGFRQSSMFGLVLSTDSRLLLQMLH
jgi:hypothetical protein